MNQLNAIQEAYSYCDRWERDRTSVQVLNMLRNDDLMLVSQDEYAQRLYMSTTTLRRHLKDAGTSWQTLLDHARLEKCISMLRHRWLPGKTMAAILGYTEPNSFYRTFRRLTGRTYADFKKGV
jgi:AraC-like DNA-binding protein